MSGYVGENFDFVLIRLVFASYIPLTLLYKVKFWVGQQILTLAPTLKSIQHATEDM